MRAKHPGPSTAYNPDAVPSVKLSDPHVFTATPEKLPTNLPCRGSGRGQRVPKHPPKHLHLESPPASKRSGAAQGRHADTSRATTYYRPLVLRDGHTQRKGVKPTVPQECPRKISRWFFGVVQACAAALRADQNHRYRRALCEHKSERGANAYTLYFRSDTYSPARVSHAQAVRQIRIAKPAARTTQVTAVAAPAKPGEQEQPRNGEPRGQNRETRRPAERPDENAEARNQGSGDSAERNQRAQGAGQPPLLPDKSGFGMGVLDTWT